MTVKKWKNKVARNCRRLLKVDWNTSRKMARLLDKDDFFDMKETFPKFGVSMKVGYFYDCDGEEMFDYDTTVLSFKDKKCTMSDLLKVQ